MIARIPLEEISKISVSINASIRQVIHAINEGAIKIAILYDDSCRVVGVSTDGDIRRALLAGNSIDDDASIVANKNFIWAKEGIDANEVNEIMILHSIEHIPILNPDGHLVSIYKLVHGEEKFSIKLTPIIIMAGGRGRRMGDLTVACPKPMIEVGGIPLIENIIKECMKQGFSLFTISINYLGQKIVEYLKDGRGLGIKIKYLEEIKELGTCGSLSYLKGKISGPFIVMNADVLNRINLKELLKFHHDEGSLITVCVREHKYEIPFGVVNYRGSKVISIEEKPLKKCFINAGVYVLDASALDFLNQDEYCDMPELIQRILGFGKQVSAFPLHEYWVDVGNPDALLRAEKTWDARS